MTPLKKGLERLNIPDRIKHLPRDYRGYPIPWFVHDGDFRIIGPGKIERAIKLNLCWVCGQTLWRHKTFLLGPMCTITRFSAEPPMHRSCALFAARACPFLTQPRMRRNYNDLPEQAIDAPGKMILHNPGAVAVWIARDFRLVPVDNGLLFRVGEPEEVRWFAHGQPASYADVMRAMGKGLPILIDEAELDGPDAKLALLHALDVARQYLPSKEEPDASPSLQPGTPAQAVSAGD